MDQNPWLYGAREQGSERAEKREMEWKPSLFGPSFMPFVFFPMSDGIQQQILIEHVLSSKHWTKCFGNVNNEKSPSQHGSVGWSVVQWTKGL